MKFILSVVVMMFASGAMANNSSQGKGDYDRGQRGDYGKDRGQRGGEDGRGWSWGYERGWDELQRDPDITIHWPSHQGVPINNLCHEGLNFRSLRPMEYCARTVVTERRACIDSEGTYCRVLRKGEEPGPLERLEEDYACAEFGVRQTYMISRTYQETECVKWHVPTNYETDNRQCLEFRNVTKQAPLTYEVQYFNTRDFVSEGAPAANYKKYTIPSCR